MNISEFFQSSAGKWASQRTSHQLAQNQSEGAKADLMIEWFSATDPALIQLCQQQGLDPTAATGLNVTWSNGIVEGSTKSESGSSLLVAIPDVALLHQGRIISRINQAQPILGHYAIGSDEVLTLTSELETIYTEERIWFASENFRLRTNVIKRNGSATLAAFYTEIRLAGKPPAEAAAAAEGSAS